MIPVINEYLRYPIGRFSKRAELSAAEVAPLLDQIGSLPDELRAALAGLTDDQLGAPYRPEGWKVGQVVHHLADSHINAYIRCKLVLTEERPTVKSYQPDAWAATADNNVDVITSVGLLEALHCRWVALLCPVSADDLQRTFIPEHGQPTRLDSTIALYAWHGRHHVAQITELRRRERW